MKESDRGWLKAMPDTTKPKLEIKLMNGATIYGDYLQRITIRTEREKFSVLDKDGSIICLFNIDELKEVNPYT